MDYHTAVYEARKRARGSKKPRYIYSNNSGYHITTKYRKGCFRVNPDGTFTQYK